MKPVLLDTGVIVALLDRSEKWHARCREAVKGLDRPLVTCEAVIAESCYLLRNLRGAALAVVESVEKGVFQIQAPAWDSRKGVKRWMAKHANRRIDVADACLLAIATELGVGEILTLDSGFRVYRWAGDRPFQILPA